MTITLSWWLIPVAMVITGLVISVWIVTREGDAYDFVTPVIGVGVLLISVMGALGVTVGKFL